jgi:hypothetical protein
MAGGRLRVEYCGEIYEPSPNVPFAIGREGDLQVDSNPFLHRRFLELRYADGLWWLVNVGSQIAATVADGSGTLDAWLGPGARLPLVLSSLTVWFTAGPTTYEIGLDLDAPAFVATGGDGDGNGNGNRSLQTTTTARPAEPTPEQRLLLVALAEPALRREGRGATEVPTSVQAADRLGWTVTKFNRKLDSLCEKLARQGVRGLYAGQGRLATNRRARLVEYALASRLVSRDDLPMLDAPYPVGG